MKILEPYRDEIVNFFDYSPTDQDQIVKKITALLASGPTKALMEEIMVDYPLTGDFGISVIHECIANHGDQWSDFIIDQFEYAFSLAEKSPDAATTILGCLDELSLVKNKKADWIKRVVSNTEVYLSSKSPDIRKEAARHIGLWLEKDNIRPYRSTVTKLQQLLNDSNWKVRYLTELALTDIGELPTSYSRSFWDHLRVKYFNPFG